MRSYTNKEGEKIEVSQEHLETAIKIKEELQKASPSRRTNWKLLVKCMEEEGFYDAESSEAYRCMIKNYQKSIGKLPSAPKHAEMVTDGKLDSLRNLVGDIAYEKRENQHVLRQINRGKNELIDFSLIVKEVAKVVEKYDFEKHKIEALPALPISNNKMVVNLADLHIGAEVDIDINKYNFNVAVARLSQFASKIIEDATNNDITDLYIVNLGDVIEHSTMRYAQGFSTEFAFSDQLVKASDLIIKFIAFLHKKGFNITYAGIAGNHDRITDKDKNINGDHAVKPINFAIKQFIDGVNEDSLNYEQAKDYSHAISLNGRNFKFVHGDLDSMKDENLLSRHSSLDGVSYDAIVMGHYHHFRNMEVGFDKRIIVFGSLKGADDFGEKIRKISIASQGIIIVKGNGEMEVKQIKLS
jgi:predicted phosphodiesterase